MSNTQITSVQDIKNLSLEQSEGVYVVNGDRMWLSSDPERFEKGDVVLCATIKISSSLLSPFSTPKCSLAFEEMSYKGSDISAEDKSCCYAFEGQSGTMQGVSEGQINQTPSMPFPSVGQVEERKVIVMPEDKLDFAMNALKWLEDAYRDMGLKNAREFVNRSVRPSPSLGTPERQSLPDMGLGI